MSRILIKDRFLKRSPGRRSAPLTTPAEIEGVPLGERGDHDLNPGLEPLRALTAAAVLVPLIDRPQGMTVLLTRRTEHLNDHAGQVSFPGGRIDPGDEDAAAAALREAEEEVGLERRHVDLVGRLDTYVTRTGFEIIPVVGLVTPGFSVRPDPFEVADIFEVPLSFFLSAENRKTESRIWQGARRYFYVYPYGEYYIWGATAGMLNNLAEILGPEGG